MAESFHHLDRNDLVVIARDIAEVAQLDIDSVAETGVGNPLDRQIPLLFGNGYRGDAAIVVFDGVHRPASPAGADFQHVIAGLELQFLAKCLVLGGLCLDQRGIGVSEVRSRIHHAFVEEEGEKLVGQIVVLADVAARRRAVVRAQQVAQTIGDAEQVHDAVFPAFTI